MSKLENFKIWIVHKFPSHSAWMKGIMVKSLCNIIKEQCSQACQSSVRMNTAIDINKVIHFVNMKINLIYTWNLWQVKAHFFFVQDPCRIIQHCFKHIKIKNESLLEHKCSLCSLPATHNNRCQSTKYIYTVYYIMSKYSIQCLLIMPTST